MAVSWSSGWLMVTIWPSFINCLITSLALIAILCANSATVIVSGTWTSMMRASTGAATLWWSSRSCPRLPRGPARQFVERPAPAPVSPRVLISFFLAVSPAQLLESLADFTSLPAPAAGAPPGLAALATVLPAAGLCKVPLTAVLASASGLASSGFLATTTFLGVDIIMRMAEASASALRRRSLKSTARAASSSEAAFEAAAAWARLSKRACSAAAIASSLACCACISSSDG